jgi:uridine kinase
VNTDITIPLAAIIDKFNRHRSAHAFTVALSGIDASGKGTISELLCRALIEKGYAVALINTDPWQHPIPLRFQREQAAKNLYENIFRWDDFFEQLVFPLKKNKKIYLETKAIRTDADLYYPLVYDYKQVDILLIEGVFLLKQKYLSFYDFTIWINCTFEVGLQRAIRRNAENLPLDRLLHDYLTFYYPAQQFHFKKDDPEASADLLIDNK